MRAGFFLHQAGSAWILPWHRLGVTMCARIRRPLAVALLLLLLFWPSWALASTLVGSYDIPQDADTVACDFLGYDYVTMDSGLRALLHNSTTSGGAGTDSNPNFPNYARFRQSLSSPALMGDYQWYSSYDGFMFVSVVDDARSDVAAAVRWWDEYGSDEGGGSGGSGDGGTQPDGIYFFPLNEINCDAGTSAKINFNNYELFDTITLEYTAGSTSTPIYLAAGDANHQPNVTQLRPAVYTTREIFDRIWQLADGKKVLVTLSQSNINVFIASEIQVDSSSTNNSSVSTRFVVSSDCKKWNIYQSNSASLYGHVISNGVETLVGRLFRFTGDGVGATSFNFTYGFYGIFDEPPSGGGGSGEPDPPGGGPIPDPPDPLPPVQDGPTYNTTNDLDINGTINNSNQEVVYEIDLSPITDRLDVINQNLVDFAEDVHASWEWLHDALDDMLSEFTEFTNNLYAWLNMIYNKMSSRWRSSPDPVESPDDALDWWEKLLDTILNLLPSQLQDIISELATLRRLFPFSIPWDLATMLTAMAHSPVTPVVRIPYPYGYANDQILMTYVVVDCAPWDGVASSVRSVFTFVWAGFLALNTRKLLGYVDV